MTQVVHHLTLVPISHDPSGLSPDLSLEASSGIPRQISRSNLPDLLMAGSRESGWVEAAISNTRSPSAELCRSAEQRDISYNVHFSRYIKFAVFADYLRTTKLTSRKFPKYYIIYRQPLICENHFHETPNVNNP